MAEVEEMIGRTVEIPAVPQVISKLQQVLESPDAKLQDVVRVLLEDPGLTTRCLRLANSAVSGLRTPCTSLRHAATILGMRRLKSVAIQSGVMMAFDHLGTTRGFDLERFWRHGAITAAATRTLGRYSPLFATRDPDVLASSGLLHNIGRLVLIGAFRDGYVEVIEPWGSRGELARQAELDAYGFDHTHVGTILAERWDLGPEAVVVTRDHHGSYPKVSLDAALVSCATRVAHAVVDKGDAGARKWLEGADAAWMQIPGEEVELVVNQIVASAAETVSLYA